MNFEHSRYTPLVLFLSEPIKQPHKTDDLSKIPQKPGPPVPLADIPPRSLSHISEASRGEQPWAITQQYQSTHGGRAPSRVSFDCLFSNILQPVYFPIYCSLFIFQYTATWSTFMCKKFLKFQRRIQKHKFFLSMFLSPNS